MKIVIAARGGNPRYRKITDAINPVMMWYFGSIFTSLFTRGLIVFDLKGYVKSCLLMILF
jgi:hypothetical protein